MNYQKRIKKEGVIENIVEIKNDSTENKIIIEKLQDEKPKKNRKGRYKEKIIKAIEVIIDNITFKNLKYFFSSFFDYFRKREIFAIEYLNLSNEIPRSIKRPIYMLYLSIIFIINCFFFDESLVHKRYLNALNGRSNNISYFFQKEFKISIYTALISSAITIFIKIIIKWIFKIDKKIIVKIRDKYFKDRYRKTRCHYDFLSRPLRVSFPPL